MKMHFNMGRHLILAAAWMAVGMSLAQAQSVDPAAGVPLIQMQNVEQSFFTQFAHWAGSVTVSNYTLSQIKGKFRDLVLQSSDIQAVFPSVQERTELANRIESGVAARTQAPISSAKFAAAMNYFGHELMGSIITKSFQDAGINSPAIQQAWRDALLAPLDRCMTGVGTIYGAEQCLNTAQAALQPNIGLAIVHQLTREQLHPSLDDSQSRKRLEFDLDNQYRACAGNDAQKPAPVKECVYAAIRKGILKVSDFQLTRTLSRYFHGSQIEQVKAAVWPPYQVCVSRGESVSQFYGCMDTLVVSSTGLAAKEKINSDPSVVSAISDARERSQLAQEMGTEFYKCAEEQKSRNVRKDGRLDVLRCQNRVENRVTRLVVRRSFVESARDNLTKGDPAEKTILANANAKVDSCWKDEMDESERLRCVRDGVIVLTEGLTSRTLDVEMPQELQKVEPQLKAGYLAGFSRCLREGIPADVVKGAAERDRQIAKCTGAVRREAGLRAAEWQLKDAFSTHLDQSQLDGLIRRNVQGKFASCLGSEPTRSRLQECSVPLVRESAKYAGKTIIPAEVRKLVAADVPPHSKAELAELEKFLTHQSADLDSCLDKNITLQKADRAASDAEGCFRSAVRGVSRYLAGFEYDYSTRPLYSGREPKRQEIRQRFLDDLTSCIDGEDMDSASLDEFLKHSYGCADQGSARVMAIVGEDQLEYALTTYLKDTAESHFEAARSEIRKSVLGEFKACLSRASTGGEAERVACLEKFQRKSTQSIGLAVGHAQVTSQLGSKPRQDIDQIERNFGSCVTSSRGGVNLSPDLDACLKRYTLDLAAKVGEIKLPATIGTMLGSKGYPSAAGQVKASVADYKKCLAALAPLPIGKEFFEGLSVCVDKLTAKGRDVLYAKLQEGLGVTDSATQSGARARAMLADAIPCLDAVLPSSPEADVEGAGLPVEGLLEEVVRFSNSFVEYDPKKADMDVQSLLSALWKDLSVLGPVDARRNLLANLEKSGAMDQFIKAVVKAEVTTTLKGLPEDQRLAAEVTAKLTERATFERIFAGKEGAAIIKRAMDQVVRPYLLDGKPLSDPALVKAKADLERDIKDLLASSPHFGRVVIASAVQKEMDSMGGVSRFFAKVIYGGDSLDWMKIRERAAGREAEKYILENILKPELRGDPLSDDEKKARLRKAKELVTQAATTSERE